MTPGTIALFDLSGQTTVVAGASRGIGAAIAAGFAGAGAEVHACGRSVHPAAAIAGVTYHACDIMDSVGFERVCETAAAPRGRIDAFVFAAGITLPAASGTQSTEAFAETLSVNLTAAYRTAMSVVARMKDSGSIVFVTSINSTLGFPGNPGYVAAKGGLRQLTKALALDLGPRGTRVNALAPGYIRTQMTAASYADPVQRNVRAARTMLGRWGEPSDLVGAAIFLVADASAYMTGQELVVDGGWTAKGL
jgi:NAD(P)-dependent dehydrogenase (short-subunit alcohol dehydrogenase family)